MRPALRAGAIALTAAALAGAHEVRADSQAQDAFSLESTAWNGLATFGALARGLGAEIEAPAELDWSELGAGDAVLVIQPARSVEAYEIAAFARRGGRIVLAARGERAAEIWARLGMVIERPGALRGAARYRGLPHAPIAAPIEGDHPLARGVSGLVGNHPAAFTHASTLDPVFAFSGGEILVAEGRVGSGRLIGLSDPSLLINRMLEIEANLEFALRLLRALGAGEGEGRIAILEGDAETTGAPSFAAGDAAPEGGLAGAARDLNDAADELGEYAPTEAALRAASVALALAIAIGVAAAPRGRRLRAFDWIAAPPASGRGPASAASPTRGERLGWGDAAAALRDRLDRKLAGAIGHAAPLSGLPERELYRRADQALGRRAAIALARVYPLLPPAHSGAAHGRAPALSRRAFQKLWTGAIRLERELPAHESKGPLARHSPISTDRS